MIDGYRYMARVEHEARIRALANEEKLFNDILSDGDGAWLTHAASCGQSQQAIGWLTSLANSLAAFGNRLKRKRKVVLDSALAGQERRGVPG